MKGYQIISKKTLTVTFPVGYVRFFKTRFEAEKDQTLPIPFYFLILNHAILKDNVILKGHAGLRLCEENF